MCACVGNWHARNVRAHIRNRCLSFRRILRQCPATRPNWRIHGRSMVHETVSASQRFRPTNSNFRSMNRCEILLRCVCWLVVVVVVAAHVKLKMQWKGHRNGLVIATAQLVSDLCKGVTATRTLCECMSMATTPDRCISPLSSPMAVVCVGIVLHLTVAPTLHTAKLILCSVCGVIVSSFRSQGAYTFAHVRLQRNVMKEQQEFQLISFLCWFCSQESTQTHSQYMFVLHTLTHSDNVCCA